MTKMKIKQNKWISLVAGMFILLVSLNSCLKNRNGSATDFSHLQDHVLFLNGGLSNFGASNVRFNTDTATYNITVNLASVNLPASPVNITIGVDEPLIAAYNAANGTNFIVLPSNAYTLKSTALIIPKGQQYVTTTLEIYQDKLDPSKSYLLPVSIKDASGKAFTSNQNTLYFNVIGNVIAGTYNWDFTRWNNPAGTGSPAGSSFTGATVSFIADNSTQVEVTSGYYIQPRYVISFTNNNGVLSNFQVSLNPDDLAALVAAGVTVTSGPNIIKADPVTGEYIFQYTTLSRYLIDRYYK